MFRQKNVDNCVKKATRSHFGFIPNQFVVFSVVLLNKITLTNDTNSWEIAGKGDRKLAIFRQHQLSYWITIKPCETRRTST